MSIRKRLIASLIGGVLFGALVAGLSPVGAFGLGLLSAGILSVVCFFLLLSAWQWAGGGKTLFWMVALAFILRMALGMGVSLALPEFGHDQPTQNAGYLFNDAFRRDVEAWDIAESGASFWDTSKVTFDSDQYFGMMVLSAGIYRFLSPDAHRAFLVLLAAAFAFAAGIPFFWKAVSLRWNPRLANLAAWILVLYPDGLIFTSSQMREPFLLGLMCIAFWAVVTWTQHWRRSLFVLASSLAIMSLFSFLIVAAVVLFLAIWFWIENLAPHSKVWRILGYAALILGAALVVYEGLDWLRGFSNYDVRVTEINSGWVQKAIEEIGKQWRLPFIMIYGLAQPVLPAAIAYPTLPIWKVIAIFRAVGWYAMAPLLLYAFYTVWRVQPQKNRRVLIWTATFLLFWMLVSSLRAGGDQWDNPRYRINFLPFLALLSAWAIHYALEKRDVWLVRWLLVEVVFLTFFTNWYFSRYFQWWKKLPFWENILWIAVLSAIILGSGWLTDIWRWWREKKKISASK